jgi:hypothetical protein
VRARPQASVILESLVKVLFTISPTSEYNEKF